MSSVKQGVLFGMGNPLLDLQARVEKSFLEKWGLKQNDAILCDDKHVPMFTELSEKHKVEYVAGGSTQNTIRVCQWMLGVPKATSYMGCIGDDEFGKILSEKAAEDGVNAVYQKNTTFKTGTCAVLLFENDRSLCAHLAAAEKFTVDHLQLPANLEIMHQAQFYYIAGFFLTVCPDAIMEVGKHAAALNKPFAMNLSAPFLSMYFKKPMLDALPYVDILFGNDSEAKAFAAENDIADESIEEVALKIAALPKVNKERARTVVITQGCDPIIVAFEEKIEKFTVEKIAKELLVDTNGAGDAFVGGYLSQLVKNQKLAVCIDAANWAARTIIQRSGCTFPKVCDYKPKV